MNLVSSDLRAEGSQVLGAAVYDLTDRDQSDLNEFLSDDLPTRSNEWTFEVLNGNQVSADLQDLDDDSDYRGCRGSFGKVLSYDEQHAVFELSQKEMDELFLSGDESPSREVGPFTVTEWNITLEAPNRVTVQPGSWELTTAYKERVENERAVQKIEARRREADRTFAIAGAILGSANGRHLAPDEVLLLPSIHPIPAVTVDPDHGTVTFRAKPPNGSVVQFSRNVNDVLVPAAGPGPVWYCRSSKTLLIYDTVLQPARTRPGQMEWAIPQDLEPLTPSKPMDLFIRPNLSVRASRRLARMGPGGLDF